MERKALRLGLAAPSSQRCFNVEWQRFWTYTDLLCENAENGAYGLRMDVSICDLVTQVAGQGEGEEGACGRPRLG